MGPTQIRLPLRFDVAPMQNDVDRLVESLGEFVHYSVLPLTAPAFTLDSDVAPPPPAENYADGTWTEWRDTPMMQTSPALRDVRDAFAPHAPVTLVRLLRLAPGARIDAHCDPTLAFEVEQSVVRLTVPIKTNERVSFVLGGAEVPMQPGECWYLRLSEEHAACNEGDSERVHLTIDVRPNGWLRELCGLPTG